MAINESEVDRARAGELIRELLSENGDDELSYRTRTRSDYEMLFRAADHGLFPEYLSMTHRGLRLRSKLVHAPMVEEAAQ